MSETSPLRPGSPSRNTVARAAQAGFSLVWLVPILALVVTLGLAFATATGLIGLVLVFPILGRYFDGIRPAATMVVAGLIKPEMKIEIEVTALRNPQ